MSYEVVQSSFWDSTHVDRNLTLVHEQPGIGPHFLSIGKTRKIVSHAGMHYLFFSVGYQIKYAVIDALSGIILESANVPGISPAWGGYNFCVEQSGDAVYLAYVTLTGDSVGCLRGRLGLPEVRWNDTAHLAVVGKSRVLAAPWIAVDQEGIPWVSVVGKDHNFFIAKLSENGGQPLWQQRPILQSGEYWIHSVVQLLPIGDGGMLAIGFAGDYPTKTSLQFKCYDSLLRETGGGKIAACNVNDKTTFHFQVVSDLRNGLAHILYLDDGLSISHAIFDGKSWNIESVVTLPSYAPQVTLDPDGNLYLLYADYQHRIKLMAYKHDRASWSYQGRLLERGAINVSPIYGATNYGTGGCISIAKTADYLVPYLTSYVDEKVGRSRLYYDCLGCNAHLRFARVERPVSWSVTNDALLFTMRLVGLKRLWFQRPNQAWRLVFRSTDNAESPWLLWLRVVTTRGDMEAGLYLRESGDWHRVKHEMFQKSCCDNTIQGQHFVLAIRESEFIEDGTGSITIGLRLSRALIQFSELADYFCETRIECGDFVDSGKVVDIWPFQEAPNTTCARNPDNIYQVFKRIL